MIDTKELRIGNIVWEDYSGEMKVVGINQLGDIELIKPPHKAIGLYDAKNLSGISLTSTWLKRFGFKRDRGGIWMNSEGIKVFENPENNFYHLNDEMLKNFDSVHDFQNWCFAWNKIELMIKP